MASEWSRQWGSNSQGLEPGVVEGRFVAGMEKGFWLV
jgi:hypothetical protein